MPSWRLKDLRDSRPTRVCSKFELLLVLFVVYFNLCSF